MTTQRPTFQAAEAQRFLTLTTGTFPPNPSELINEQLLAQIFAALRKEFDYVIVDCPRLTTVVDTMTLAHYADFVLSVVNVAHTPRRAFAAHMETLGTLDRRQGMIINGVLRLTSRYGYVYGYGYSYGYGYGDRRNGGWLGRVSAWLKRLGEG